MEYQQKDNKTLSFDYVLKKTERINAAIVILSERIQANNPYRALLVEKTIPLYETALQLASGRFPVFEDTVQRFKDNCGALLSILEIAKQSQLVSSANASLLRAELLTLGQQVEELQKANTEAGKREPRFSDSFLRPTSLFGASEPMSIQPLAADQVEADAFLSRTQSYIKDSGIPTNLSDKLRQGTTSGPTPSQNSDKRQAVAPTAVARHKDRRAQILQILQTKDKITIKDVSNQITDCSEKTIQRELLKLVDQGVLKKEGERRWSTYTLAG